MQGRSVGNRHNIEEYRMVKVQTSRESMMQQEKNIYQILINMFFALSGLSLVFCVSLDILFYLPDVLLYNNLKMVRKMLNKAARLILKTV